jgi:hypothetical protein
LEAKKNLPTPGTNFNPGPPLLAIVVAWHPVELRPAVPSKRGEVEGGDERSETSES